MDGSQIERTTAYLSRLLGEPVSADQQIRLRSVQRAALASWARKQDIPIRSALTGSDASFSPLDLLQSGPTEAHAVRAPAAASATRDPSAAPGASPLTAVGIDIEDIDSLPASDDYREHPFFQDHFTPAEIAYCLRQADVPASFCGTWAAKEAVLKSGVLALPVSTLNAVEIGRDSVGRPTYPGCQLSISHSKRAAVAICIAFTSSASPPQSPAAGVGDKPTASPRPRMAHTAMACVGIVLVAVLAVASLHLAG